MDAKRLADQDLGLDANYWIAYKVKGQALAGLGCYDEALEPLRKAYEADPYEAGLAFSYAKVLCWNGKYKAALDPALVNLSMSVASGSKDETDKKLLLSLIRRFPETVVERSVQALPARLDRSLLSANFHFALAAVLDQAQMQAAAIEQYRAGLALNPNFAQGIFGLGRDLELQRGEYNEALLCYTRAHELEPDDAEIARYYNRLESRMAIRSGDIAWHLKDWLSGLYDQSTKKSK
jgi:tetratricopeptide (TPR) repeat protein